jgi:hypothetical protein
VDWIDLMAVVERGSGLIVGTATDDGEPRATRAWAVVLAAGTQRARVIVSADDPSSVIGLRNGRVAVTAADVRTLRAVQMKGRVTAVEPASSADIEMMDLQSQAFFEAVHEVDGNPVEQLRRILPHQVVAVEFDVEEWFDQSPGPGAGAVLGRAV